MNNYITLGKKTARVFDIEEMVKQSIGSVSTTKPSKIHELWFPVILKYNFT